MTNESPTPALPIKKSKRRKLLQIAAAVILVPLIGIQFVPVSRANPPVTGEIAASDEVLAVLRESCYDCHSNETRWPWYSHIAPMSWFLADHVHEARENMNFSEWDKYDISEREYLIQTANAEVHEGEMPLKTYLWLHASAVPTDEDKAIISAWSKSNMGSSPAPKAPESHADHDHDDDH